MSFLWPLAWALGALAIPITVLYLIRTRLERKPVSTALFWQHVTPQVYNSSLWRRLRRWISLALQLLFLLVLIFAISQPMASWQSAKPASVILILDASVSMTATDVAPNRWAEALQTAQRRIAQLRFFDEAIVIEACDSPRVLCGWSRNKRALNRALLTAKPTLAAGEIRPALTLAHNLAGQRKAPEIDLISDGVWPNPPTPEAMQGVQAHWIGKAPVNAGLTLFNVRRSLAAPGDYQLIARVVASGAMTAQLEVRRNGVLMDVQPLKLEPGKPWQRTWDGTASGPVPFEATLTGMLRDDLAADNRAEAHLDALHPVEVELVAPPHAFLDAVLDALPLVTVHRTWPSESHPLVAANDPRKLFLFYRCVPPPDFHPAAMLVINPAGDGIWGKYNGPLDSALVSETLRDEPIMRFVSLDSVHLQKARDFTPPPGAKLYAQSFGKPLVFGRWGAGNTWPEAEPRWLAFSFGLEDSDLVLRTAFPILLGNLVQSLQPDAPQTAQTLPGATASQLKATHPVAPNEAGVSPEPTASKTAWWTNFPLWWWAIILGALWLLAEWWSFSRRITE